MSAVPDMGDWLEISGVMLRQLLPGDPQLYFGQALSAADFAALVERESVKVDHALVALGTASGLPEVEAIMQQLDRDTLIALFSRWAQYTQAWRTSQQPHWMPARSDEVWRAVFLSMAAGAHAQAAAHKLWPEAFAAAPGSE